MSLNRIAILLAFLLCATLTGCGTGGTAGPASSSAPAEPDASSSAPAESTADAPAEIPDPPDEGGTGIWAYKAVHAKDEISYMFQDVMISIPASWAGKYAIEQKGDDSVTFFHKESRKQIQESGHRGGGILFTVCASPDKEKAEQGGHFQLGDTEDLYYYLTFPADLESVLSDTASREWAKLSKGTEYIKWHSWVTKIDET